MATIGNIQEFQQESESITAYLERVELYLTANGIEDERKVPVLLSVIGSKTYGLLRSLAAPDKPQEKTLEQLTVMLKDHFEPKPVVIAERFHFHRRVQAVGESVAEYLAELKRLAAHCDFGPNLNQTLRDRFVCGLANSGIQRKLLAEHDLTYAKAVEVALGMEAADKNAHQLKGNQMAIKKVVPQVASRHTRGAAQGSHSGSQTKSSDNQPCYRCGSTQHQSQQCKFKGAKCHYCKKLGHIARVCRQKKASHSGQQPATSRQTHQIAIEEDDSLPLFHVTSREHQPILVEVEVNGCNLSMEVDTGAARSIISQAQQEVLFPSVKLNKSPLTLRTYTSERVEVVGELPVKVQYKGKQYDLSLLVVPGNGSTLLGRDWMEHITLDWKQMACHRVVTNYADLASLLEKHHEVFKDELGTVRDLQATLQLKAAAKPKFFRPRSVPYAIRAAIGSELDRLEAAGIVEKVVCSDWAAPIVPVPKKDGKFRICGDYKVTLNPVLEVDQHPLPRPEEIFASLAGGKKFTTLDLSQAYQQILLDEASRKLVTINTHQGLYRYTRLPFGVASAPAIFQRTMDVVLQGIPSVMCYIDDIIITGPTEQEHLATLSTVLERLQSYGFRLKQSKCTFMGDSVEYLGHVIDAKGLHATPEKLAAIRDAPSPRNIQELRSFLGLLNYYGKFIPNLSTLIHPLNGLLGHNAVWNWTEVCTKAFNAAKSALLSTGVLAHYDPTLPVKLAADASAYGVGAVLSHQYPDGSERPIAFASRTLSTSEKNYAQLEKEALALIFGVKKSVHLWTQIHPGHRSSAINHHSGTS